MNLFEGTARHPAHLSSHPDDHDRHPHSSSDQASLLGSESVHSRASPEEELEDEDHAREVSSWSKLSWWRRPSPYWLIFGVPFTTLGHSALLAPQVAMYTELACRVHRPEYIAYHNTLHSFAHTPPRDLVTMNAVDTAIPQLSHTSETTVDTVFVPLSNSAYTASSEYPEGEPDVQQKCASDPVVQAVVARLNAVFLTAMGVLSCLTTGWWGSFSDRFGRRIVFFAPIFGHFVTDITHVMTMWFVDVLPGGYWFPLIGFMFEGLCGSMATAVAVTNAYLADTTSPSTRSRYFALSFGLLFAGIAIGPALGGLLIHLTGTILSVFYFVSVLHGVYAIFVLCFLPESLTRTRARGAWLRRKQEKANQASSGHVLSTYRSIARLLSPFLVLLPEQSSDTSIFKRHGKDWNLFFVAMAYGLSMSIIGSFFYKFQYATAQFKWTSEDTSYYISFIGAIRAIFLAVILPLIIKVLKPAPIQLPSTSDEPLLSTNGRSPSRGASPPMGLAQTRASGQLSSASRSPAFDLALARVSAGIESVSYLSMAVANTGPLFTLATAISSFGSAFPPTSQALALDIYASRRSQNQGEVGRLFGALSVLQALMSQIISPALYGLVYYNTVAVFPQAIMIVSMCTSLLALTFISFVRIPSKSVGDHTVPEHGNEERNQGTAAPEILVTIGDDAAEGR